MAVPVVMIQQPSLARLFLKSIPSDGLSPTFQNAYVSKAEVFLAFLRALQKTVIEDDRSWYYLKRMFGTRFAILGSWCKKQNVLRNIYNECPEVQGLVKLFLLVECQHVYNVYPCFSK